MKYFHGSRPHACACIVPDPGAAAPRLGSAIPHCTGQWSDIFTIGSAPVLSLQETSRLAGVLNGGPALNTRLYNTVNTRQRNAWLFAFARDRNIRERTSSCLGKISPGRYAKWDGVYSNNGPLYAPGEPSTFSPRLEQTFHLPPLEKILSLYREDRRKFSSQERRC